MSAISSASQQLRKAVVLYARRHPENILGKLLKDFSPEVVAKLLQLYSGEWIQLPLKSDVWKTWRNMYICEEIEKVDKNDKMAIKEKKNELAKTFNLTYSRVAGIYYEERENYSKEFAELDKIAQKIYDEEFKILEKEVRDTLGKKHKKGVILGPGRGDEE